MLCPYRSTAHPGAVPWSFEYDAALGQHRLLFVVFGHFAAGVSKYSSMRRRLSSSGTSGRPRTSATVSRVRSSCVGPSPRSAARGRCGPSPGAAPPQTVDIVSDRGLVQHPDPVSGKLTGQELAVGIDDIPQQQLGTDGDDLRVHTKPPETVPPGRRDRRIFLSGDGTHPDYRNPLYDLPADARDGFSMRASASKAASASSSIARRGFVRGCRGVKTVQQSSYGWIEVSNVPIFRAMAMISSLSIPMTGRNTGRPAAASVQARAGMVWLAT